MPADATHLLMLEIADVILTRRTMVAVCDGIAQALRRCGNLPAAGFIYMPEEGDRLSHIAVRAGEPTEYWNERLTRVLHAAAMPGQTPGELVDGDVRLYPLRRNDRTEGFMAMPGGPELTGAPGERLAVWMHNCAQTKSMAVHDPLTGLHNRNYIESLTAQMLMLCRRNRQPVSVMMIDIDHFKHVNDELGHMAGDRLLAEFATRLERQIRGSDLAFRYGGDEFLVVMPNTRLVAACEVARRLRDQAADIVVHPGRPEMRCRISVGLAEDQLALDWHNLLAHADAALYHVKRHGRDNIAGYDSDNDAIDILIKTAPEKMGAAEPVKHEVAHMLVVDDDPLMRRVMQRTLESMDGWQVRACDTIAAALAEIRAHPNHYDVVFTDLNMPNEDGFVLLDGLDRLDVSIARVIVTGHATLDNTIQGLRHRVLDIIQKPFQPDVLLRSAVRALAERRMKQREVLYRANLERECSLRMRELEKTVGDLRRTQWMVVKKFAAMVDLREHQTGLHSQRVARMAVIMAAKMDFEPEKIEHLRRGALLHDIGKIAVPDSILLKQTPLTDDEWVVIREHVKYSAFLLKDIDFLKDALPVVLYHHEAWDGRGYPAGLRGMDIPLEARIMAMVDSYDAMRMERCYRPTFDQAQAVAELDRCSGTQFDPALVRIFHDCLPEIEAVFGMNLAADDDFKMFTL